MIKINYANRGKQLEQLIDRTNMYYRNVEKADIRKIPTPFKVLGNTFISKLKRNAPYGHWDSSNWVDYVGVYNGLAIAFDAKETKENRFDLKNISEQQYEFLESYYSKGAFSFIIVHLSNVDEYFLVYFDDLKYFKNRSIIGGKKSISYKELKEICFPIEKEKYILNYLEVLQ